MRQEDSRLVIAVDAMGGDDAPSMVLKGVRTAHKRYPDVSFLLFGDKPRLETLLKRKMRRYCTIRHAPDVVSNEDKPSQALRRGRESSMWLAIKAVKDGEADGVVSAGNTGALMAMAKLCLRTLPGIHRPALATVLPTVSGETVMLDLGANAVCDAGNLVEFAVMGSVFSRILLGLSSPSVGLLNVGAEELKGTEALRQASSMLKEGVTEGMNFVGFVEGNDIGLGTVDVVVTDGFTGNVALKAVEGTAKLYSSYLKLAFQSSFFAKLGFLLARSAIEQVRARTDPRRYNGAMLLGLTGVCVKSHGGTDALGFANAVAVAVDLVSNQLNDKIREGCEHLAALWVERPPPAGSAQETKVAQNG